MSKTYLEPAMARFAQKDIERGELTDTISQNRYLYAANDPVNYTDPSGEFKLTIINPLKTIGNGIRNKLPDPLKSVYDYGACAGETVGRYRGGYWRTHIKRVP